MRRDYRIDEVRELPTTCGIYAIVNVQNGDRYVGQALNIRERTLTHVRDLMAGRERTNKDGLLQNAWNEFGRDNFVVRVLEIINDNRRMTAYRVRPDNIDLAEHYYINERSEYNRDKKIVAGEFHALIGRKAWREKIAAETLALIAAVKPRAYLVARKKDWAHAIIVLGRWSEEAKLVAAQLDPEIKALGGNISTKRLSAAAVLRELANGAKDLRPK